MNKQSLWKQIQERAPDLAEFLKQVNEKLGKPESVEVKFKEEA
jgi:hypothetical protein